MTLLFLYFLRQLTKCNLNNNHIFVYRCVKSVMESLKAATCLKLLKTSRDVAKFQKNELERI